MRTTALELTERNRFARPIAVLTVLVVMVAFVPAASALGAGRGVVSTGGSAASRSAEGAENPGGEPSDTTVPGGENGPGDETSTSVPPSSTTPSSTTTTTTLPTDGSTTTTIPYLPEIPPELVDDPRLPFLVDPDEDSGFDMPIAQLSFDPLSVGVLPERVTELQLRILKESLDLMDKVRRLATLADSVDALESKVAGLRASQEKAVRRAADARRALRDQAVLAYTQGRADLELSILELTDAVDIGVAKEYMSVLMGRQADLAKEYEEATRALDKRSIALADELGVTTSQLDEARNSVGDAVKRLKELKAELAVFELGAHVYVAGFVFPLASEAEFIDSWGYPRMVGTASEHWHQGTDIFAPYGAPAVASENGVIQRLGQASLGGNKLWVRGESGTSYYYAHLSAFAEGMENGRRVRAGEVVGYVGDTGNAKGTSPHLHFEVHPANGPVVNAYPLLRAAYGNRGAFRAVVERPPEPDSPTEENPSGN